MEKKDPHPQKRILWWSELRQRDKSRLLTRILNVPHIKDST